MLTKKELYANKTYRQIRAEKFLSSPNCLHCQLLGRSEPATDLHHILKFYDQIGDNNKICCLIDPENMITLCGKCHKHIHGDQGWLHPDFLAWIDKMKLYLLEKYQNAGFDCIWTNDHNRRVL